MSVHTYRVVKQINGLGTIKFRVEQRVLFFFWCELATYSFDTPTGKETQFETRGEAAQFIADRLRKEDANTWVRAK